MSENNEIRDYVETVQDHREASLEVLYKLVDGEITNPEDLDAEDPNDAEELAGILEELGGEEWRTEDDARDALNEFGLGMDTKILVTLDIGVGGPSDWIEATCSKGQYGLELDSATYYSAWGSDRRERNLQPGSALYRWTEEQIEYATID